MDVYLAYVLIKRTKRKTHVFICSVCIKAAHTKTQSCKINCAVPHKCRNSTEQQQQKWRRPMGRKH